MCLKRNNQAHLQWCEISSTPHAIGECVWLLLLMHLERERVSTGGKNVVSVLDEIPDDVEQM